MDSFNDSCDRFSEYPKNLVRHDGLEHSTKAYHTRLGFQSKDLFDERLATVDFLELHKGSQEYVGKPVGTLNDLRHQLRNGPLPQNSDPLCRFVFLHAKHSRDPLRISCDMLKLLFTWHQVMPSFLDFVFPFGRQIYPRDLYFSGFREESRLASSGDGTAITKLGRSGSEMRICYNLRSVERSEDSSLPWSIRQSAVYQTLDIQTGHVLWVVVKGNRLIKSRITEACKRKPWLAMTQLSEAFATTLRTHLLMCDWSGENWRWYINDLEDRLQVLTRGVLTIQVDTHASPGLPAVTSDAFFASPRPRTGTMPPLSPSATDRFAISPRVVSNQFSIRSQSNNFSPQLVQPPPPLGNLRVPTAASNDCTSHDAWAKAGLKSISNAGKRFAAVVRDLRKWNVHGITSRWSRNTQLSPTSSRTHSSAASSRNSEKRMDPDVLPPTHSDKGADGHEKSFTFRDLQRIQHIEDKTQEALLVLTSNTEVLEELRQHYQHAVIHADFPSTLRNDCQDDLDRFDRCVLGVKKDLQMLQARTQNLLQLTANRKNLLNDILQFRNSRASERLAEEAAQSAQHMQAVTDSMWKIAKRTQRETTSMKIITSVSVTLTLFFLPATFTATFMSADILKYEQGEKNFQIKGLNLFLEIALPLTMLTFFAWYAFYHWAKKNEVMRGEQSEARFENV